MDGQKEGNAPAAEVDAAETIRQQQRGDQATTTTLEQTEGQQTGGDGTQPLVDLSQRDANAGRPAAAKDAAGLTGATIEGESIVFGAPGEPDLQGQVTTNERGALVVPPEGGAVTPPEGTAVVPPESTAVVPPGPPDTTGGDTPPLPPGSEFGAEYNAVPQDGKVPLPPEVEQKIAEQMAEYQKQLEASNYSIAFGRGEGPWNAITRQQNEARAKQAAGKELSPQEQAILGLKHDDVLTEARRIRDRDFKVLTTEDGKPRNWYKLNESTGRWSEQEVKDMMVAQEKTLREAAEKEVKAAKEAEEAAEAARQQALAEAIDKNVPSEGIVKDAATSAGVEGEPAQIREAMKAHVAQEIANGSLKPEDLERPYPRVGAALVGTGALTGEELTAALAKQAELKAAAPEGTQAPRLDEVLKDIYKDNPEKLAKLEKASKFYDELKRLTDEARAKEATMPAEPPAPAGEVVDPFAPEYSTVVPAPTGDQTPPVVPPADGQTEAERAEAQRRRDVLREVSEKPPGVVTDLKQAPSGYLALKAFQAGGLDTRTWTATNDAQRAIVANLGNEQLRTEVAGISSDVLDGKASVGDVTPVNDFLKAKGLDIQLQPIGENDIAMAATLGVKGQWAARASEMEVNGQKYKSVDLPEVKSYDVNGQTVVQLYSGADGMEVYASPLPEDLTGEQILARAQELTPNGQTARGKFGAARIPMVKMDARTTLSDLVGMSSDKGETISQAEMQTKLNLDQHGFSVEQGLALAVSRSAAPSPEQFTFDKPFMLWVKTKDGSQPLAAVRVDERFWKDPKGDQPAPAQSPEK